MFNAKNILVMRYRFLGDTILTVPFLRNLRRAAPQAKIDMLVGPASGEVLKGCPYVDEFIPFDTTRFHKYDQGKGDARSYWSYFFELRKRNYDCAFVLKRSLSSAFLALGTGARIRAGYATEGRSLLLTHKVRWDTSVHEVDSLASVLEAVGITAHDKHLEAWISKDETRAMREKVSCLDNHRSRMLIHAAAAHPDKTYPLEHFAEVIKGLHSEFGMTPFFTGDSKDRESYEELAALAGIKSVNMAGELSIRESMALYKEMDIAVCVDSGPAHLSCAVGTPTVTLFGPTDPVRWQPIGPSQTAVFDDSLECRPCHYKKTCSNRECLTQLPPMKVIEAARHLINNRRPAIS